MAKIALLVSGACILFGLFKIVAPNEDNHANKANAPSAEEQEQYHNEKLDSHPIENRDQKNLRTTAMYGQRPYTTTLTPLINLVECYACTDCPKATTDTPSKLCPYTLDPSKNGRCVVYAEQYKHMKKPWYIRGCATERGSCSDIRKAHASHADIVSLIFCTECEGDKCNTNGAQSLSDFTMAFFAMVVTPLVTKYTLS